MLTQAIDPSAGTEQLGGEMGGGGLEHPAETNWDLGRLNTLLKHKFQPGQHTRDSPSFPCASCQKFSSGKPRPNLSPKPPQISVTTIHAHVAKPEAAR